MLNYMSRKKINFFGIFFGSKPLNSVYDLNGRKLWEKRKFASSSQGREKRSEAGGRNSFSFGRFIGEGGSGSREHEWGESQK